MPHADAITLDLLDRGLRALGTFAFAIVALRIARDGRWRDPLAGAGLIRSGPSLGELVGIIAGFYALLLLAAQAVSIDREGLREVGSHAWHVARCIEDGAKLTLCGVVLVILHRRPLFTEMPGLRFRLGGTSP
jgi:hypothetical protein